MIPPSGSEPPNLHATLGLDDRSRRLLWPGTVAELHRRGFDLGEPLAQGATSVVFACIERATGRKLVLKVCHDPSQLAAVEYFRRERRILAGVPALVNLLPHYYGGLDEAGPPFPGGEPCQPFLLLEYVSGSRITDHLLAVAGVPLEHKVGLCAELARSVQRLHELNLVHGDLSTNNVLVDQGGRVRLIDLGQGGPLRRTYQPDDKNLDRAGTEGFSPASLLARRELPSQASDIRQATAVVFHLLTGELAGSDCEAEGTFRRQGQLDRMDVPPELGQIVQRGLRDRDDRLSAETPDPRLYRTAGEFAAALERWQNAGRRRRQSWQLAVGAMVALTVVLGCALWVWARWQQQFAREAEMATAFMVQSTGLTHTNHPAIVPLRSQLFDLELAESRARTDGDWENALRHLRGRIELLRQIEKRHAELSRLAQLCEDLTSIIDHASWVQTAPLITQSVQELTAQGTELQELLKLGNVEAVGFKMASFHQKLAATIRMNADARPVAEVRAELERLWSRLASQDTPGTVQSEWRELRLHAEREWGAGHWSEANRLYEEVRLGMLAELGNAEPPIGDDVSWWTASRRLHSQSTGTESRMTDLETLSVRSPRMAARPSLIRGTKIGTAVGNSPPGKDWGGPSEVESGSPRGMVAEGPHAGAQMVVQVNGVSFPFRWCPPGTFRMGSPPEEWKRELDEEQVDVTLSRGFWLLESEVTQRMWRTVLGADREYFWEEKFGRGDDYPAYRVNGVEAERFCELLTERLRHEEWLGPDWRVMLPTEAQWEYACRAGSVGRYCCGEDELALQEFAWFAPNAEATNHPVRSRQPNRWGLYDMHGSLWEWTASRYERRLPGGVDPASLEKEGTRVVRGGSWVLEASGCRSAIRKEYGQHSSDVQSGVRLCLMAGFSGY